MRAAQHLDPFNLAKISEARAGARAIDAIDEHGDRAFEARIRGVPFASDPVEETSSDGASWLSWRMSLAPLFCNDCAVTAETAIGTFESGLARRVAVTMISPVVSASSALPVAGDAVS